MSICSDEPARLEVSLASRATNQETLRCPKQFSVVGGHQAASENRTLGYRSSGKVRRVAPTFARRADVADYPLGRFCFRRTSY